MQLKSYLTDQKNILEPHILQFLQSKKNLAPDVPFLQDSLNRLEQFVTQGKMLRGILVLMSAEMFGREIGKSELNAAAALELSHSALLVHDDIMDNDLKRRGHPTIYAQYISEASESNVSDSKTYGISQGICVGDMSIFFAFELLSQVSGDDTQRSRLTKFYSEELAKVCAAQMQDVAFGHSKNEPSIEEILNVYVYKSGRYTFSLPLVMGAILAGRDGEIIAKLDTFGEKLGTIFQIKDDELGLFGEEEQIGKPVGSDIREDKKTIFRALLFKKATPEQKGKLNAIFGSEHLTMNEIEQIRELMKTSGVLDEVQETVESLFAEVKTILEQIDVVESYKNLLNDFIEYNVLRKV